MKNLYCYIALLAICWLSVTVQGTSNSNYRLPKSVHPEHYRVEILTHLNDEDQGFKYYGKVWIKVSVEFNQFLYSDVVDPAWLL